MRRVAAAHTDPAPMGTLSAIATTRNALRLPGLTWPAPTSPRAPTGGRSAGTSWASVTLPGFERSPDMPKLEGKAALITGGARWIGKAIARALPGDGSDFAIADI